MPTYRNDTSSSIYLGAGRYLAPDASFESTRLLDHLPGIVRISDTPAYNPIAARHNVEITAGTAKEVILAHPLEISRLVIIATAEPLELALNHPDNAPRTPIPADNVIELSPRRSLSTVHLTAGTTTTATILEVTDEED